MPQWTYASRMLVVLSILIRFLLVSSDNWLKYSVAHKYMFYWNIAQGVVFLLFPLSGVIADLRSLHYKMIKIAFILSMVSSVLMVVIACLIAIDTNNSLYTYVLFTLALAMLVVTLFSLGLYEATALQYGMRQLFEAPTKQLVSFIHWYFWGLFLSPLIVYYIDVIFLISIQDCKLNANGYSESGYIFGLALFSSCSIQSVTTIIGLIILIKSKPRLETDLARFNPFKLIIKVLNYARKHKQPEYRSAFTYWENTIPSRIDFGKMKYGGPFTHEEVEDTKVFFRLLLLPLSLFGFFIQDSGYSMPSLMYHKLGCPSLATFILFNPSHLKFLTIVIGIPLYRVLINSRLNRYIPNMLTQIWIGLFLLLVYCFLNSLLTIAVPHTLNTPAVDIALEKTRMFISNPSSVLAMCILNYVKVINSSTGECVPLSVGLINDSYLFYLLALPQVISGLSFLLVFMTVLEFICAQAPHTMKGLLIGIWYAMFSIQFIGTHNLELYGIRGDSVNQWSIYNGTVGLATFVSLVLFSVYCKFYRYRERNEVVNEQAIIEEQYERELLLNSSNSSTDTLFVCK